MAHACTHAFVPCDVRDGLPLPTHADGPNPLISPVPVSHMHDPSPRLPPPPRPTPSKPLNPSYPSHPRYETEEQRGELVPMLREVSRQEYLRKREDAKLKELEDELEDAKYLFEGVELTEKEKADLRYKQTVRKGRG
jgi:hypothetical protein